jgi:spermidine/putrescine-binding protein
MTLLTLGYDPNSNDPAQLAAAQAKLLELTPNVRFFDSDRPKTALIAGDADLGVIWSGEASLAQAETPAVTYIAAARHWPPPICAVALLAPTPIAKRAFPSP